MRALCRRTIGRMRLVVAILLAPWALAVHTGLRQAAAAAATVVRAPVDDVGLPFWCNWSYDWEARCYRDSGPRLPLGGVEDKVWRAGLRFSLAGIPAGATVAAARLELTFDGVCVAPQLSSMACSGDGFPLAAYPIASAEWYHEREPDYFWTVEDEVYLDTSATGILAWDLTGLVREWLDGTIENNGVLLKVADGREDFGVGGPYFASMSASDPVVRPRLVIEYSSPTGLAR
jgi:hypothetical protein